MDSAGAYSGGHIVYHFPKDHVLFLRRYFIFQWACGRLFEGTAETNVGFFTKNKKNFLNKTKNLLCPMNIRNPMVQFALTIDPDNQRLQTKNYTSK